MAALALAACAPDLPPTGQPSNEAARRDSNLSGARSESATADSSMRHLDRVSAEVLSISPTGVTSVNCGSALKITEGLAVSACRDGTGGDAAGSGFRVMVFDTKTRKVLASSRGFGDAYSVDLEIVKAAQAPETVVLVASEAAETPIGAVLFRVGPAGQLSEIGAIDAVLADADGDATAVAPALDINVDGDSIVVFLDREIQLGQADGSYRPARPEDVCWRQEGTSLRQSSRSPSGHCGGL